MELFKNAKTVRLKSHHDKYLLADEDEEHVSQDRNGSTGAARWSVEIPDGGGGGTGDSVLRLKSCHGRYLTASNEPMFLGMTGRKVIQSVPRRLDSSVEWEPIRDGFQVKLKTRYGHYLRANGGLPPWRNSITHDIPYRTSTQDWVLWDVEIVEVQTKPHGDGGASAHGNGRYHHQQRAPIYPPPPPPPDFSDWVESSPEATPSMLMRRLSRDESSSSFSNSLQKSDGRSIYYVIAEDDGPMGGSTELCITFKGTSVKELTEKLEEITEITDGVIVCSRNPLNGMLCPLRLHLPPNNTTMHVVVVRSSSKGDCDPVLHHQVIIIGGLYEKIHSECHVTVSLIIYADSDCPLSK